VFAFAVRIARRMAMALFRALIPHDALATWLHASKLDEWRKSSVSHPTTRFHPEAAVWNFQGDPRRIEIGMQTHIRGELLVFAYGGEIMIGSCSYVGAHSRIHSGERVVIGNHVLISHNVNIADTDSHELSHLDRAEGFRHLITEGHATTKGGIVTAPVVIEDHAWIGLNAVVLKGVRIGRGAVVAAASVVTRDVPPFTLVAGNPARVVRQLEDADNTGTDGHPLA
jgi:acetyltransferase-like isoleucine patch superfamily enzyme